MSQLFLEQSTIWQPRELVKMGKLANEFMAPGDVLNRSEQSGAIGAREEVHFRSEHNVSNSSVAAHYSMLASQCDTLFDYLLGCLSNQLAIFFMDARQVMGKAISELLG